MADSSFTLLLSNKELISISIITGILLTISFLSRSFFFNNIKIILCCLALFSISFVVHIKTGHSCLEEVNCILGIEQASKRHNKKAASDQDEDAYNFFYIQPAAE